MNVALLDQMGVLADPVRCRLAALLRRQELSVSELQAILQLPQSTVSRHLKLLAKEGLVAARTEGASHLYRVRAEALSPAAAQLLTVLDQEIGPHLAVQQDEQRLQVILAERHRRSQEFFQGAAGEWDRMREELFGPGLEFQMLAGLLDPRWTVGDLGCGTGHVAHALAPFVSRIIAVDESEAMLAAARLRCTSAPSVEFRQGALEALPLGDAELDLALLSLVLPYAVDPARLLAEVARVLTRGGMLLALDLALHSRTEYRQTMGHLRDGVDRATWERWGEAAGLAPRTWAPLPPHRTARGPALFLATAYRP